MTEAELGGAVAGAVAGSVLGAPVVGAVLGARSETADKRNKAGICCHKKTVDFRGKETGRCCYKAPLAEKKDGV
jgi:hypothetical protein